MTSRPAVLLLAFGGPATLDEVGPFMERLMRREPSPEMVEKARDKYRLIGGGSPLPRLVGELADAVRVQLHEEADVYVGMRYAEPFVEEAARALIEAGHDGFVAISLSPQYSDVSSGAYERALLAAIEKEEAFEGTFILVESWHTREGFVDAIADRLNDARGALGESGRWPVVFTAHSLPMSDRGVARYRDQVTETVDGVLDRVGARVSRIAYQSKGRAEGEWLGPMIEDVFEDLAGRDAQGVLVVPVGFVTEHMETLYDLDIEARKAAEARGLGFARVPTVGTHPAFVGALADVARDHIAELGRGG